MKLYKNPTPLVLKEGLNQSIFCTSGDCELVLKGGVFFIQHYNLGRVYRRHVKYNEKNYEVRSSKIFLRSIFPFRDGTVQVFNYDGNQQNLDLEPEKLYVMVNDVDSYSISNHVSVIRDYPSRRKKSLAVYDSELDTFNSKEIGLFIWSFIEESFYGFDLGKRVFQKINKKLETVWSLLDTQFGLFASEPKKYLNTVIVFIGPENEERNLIEGYAKYNCSGGNLYGLSDADGSIIWQIRMPNSMDSYELVGDTLYVVSLNEIFLINPTTGEIKHALDTETSIPFNRDLKPTITIDDKLIYYTHYDDAVILVYDVNSLELVRRIEMPEGYYPKEHNFHDKHTGRQYFTIHNKTQYVAQWPVLEIDPQNLDEEVEFEQEPDIEIKLQASPDNIDERELVIRLTSESLDDALRFGEIYTRDEAQRYSYNYVGMTFQDRPFMPEKSFNGVIRFIYSGCDQSAEIVNEHLRVMEKRFSKWNEKEGFFACTDKKKPTCLIAEYAE